MEGGVIAPAPTPFSGKSAQSVAVAAATDAAFGSSATHGRRGCATVAATAAAPPLGGREWSTGKET